MDLVLFLLPFAMMLLPLGVVYFAGEHFFRKLNRYKAPVSEKMLRPPGESVRLKLNGYFEQAFETLIPLVFVPIIVSLSLINLRGQSGWWIALFVLIALGSIAFGYVRFKKALRRLVDYSLGFKGERFVGGLLEQLREKGYKVFHDLPFDSFNIDHAVVGPAGVFAIETKTRRKKANQAGDKGKVAKVIFDGKALQFPEWSDSHGIQQACNQARHLATRLSAATGERVVVEPILVLPGWWVEATTIQPLRVVNPKQPHFAPAT
jgi:hypothetical protein